MADDLVADDKAVAEPVVEESVVEDQEVQGEVVPNDEPMDTETEIDNGSEPSEPDNEEVETAEPPAETGNPPEPAPELTPEVDEAGVYEPVTATDPGDFTPGDYSFEVTTTDGKTVKLTSQEEVDAFAERLDENPDLISASQFTKFTRLASKMDSGLDRDRAQYETQKQEYDAQVAQVQVREETISKWDKELSYLTANGDIPALKPEHNTAEAGRLWQSTFKDEPGVKERLEIMQFMDQENSRRLAAGLEPMNSMLDAYDKLKLQRMLNTEQDTTVKERQTRRAKGAMVTGTSPYIPSNQQPNEIVGEGGNVRDIW